MKGEVGTDAIANFVANITYDDIPRAVGAAAKTSILDGLGVTLAGGKSQPGHVIISYVGDSGGKPEAGIVGAGFRSSAAQAALANGVLAHALDYDDGVSRWGGHLTAVVLPAVLALSEREKRSGKETIEAFVAGWEVGEKIGAVIGPDVKYAGWHSHAVVGPLAAAAAASKALKLDEKQIKMALGIAASGAGGLRLNFGTDTKPFHAGRGAWNGVVAALLAQKGFTATSDILDADLGLPRVFTGKKWDPAHFTARLGNPFSLITPGAHLKPYPSCGRTQASIDAVLFLKAKHHFRPEEEAEIECRTSRWTQEVLSFSRPETIPQAKFSMQYCLAAAVLDGEITMRQFTDEKISSPGVQDFVSRVKYAPHVEGKDFAEDTVTVRLRDGREYSRTVAHARGEPENPMSRDDLILKFGACAEPVLSRQEIQQTIGLVTDLEALEDITPLMVIATH
ncbi:MAG: MmgE/PrpD family protein [Chloroflexi bacterium]|nr:MmgE/PrpD family protein [Chloroflexota bacterium]